MSEKKEFDIESIEPVKFLPDCKHQYQWGSVTKCDNDQSSHYGSACSKRCLKAEKHTLTPKETE